MNLYFDVEIFKLYLLPNPENDEQIIVEDFDVNNIESAYNILYIGGDCTTVQCVENIDSFKAECNSIVEEHNNLSGENDLIDNNNFEYSEEHNSTRFIYGDITDYTPIIYFDTLEIENSCFLK